MSSSIDPDDMDVRHRGFFPLGVKLNRELFPGHQISGDAIVAIISERFGFIGFIVEQRSPQAMKASSDYFYQQAGGQPMEGLDVHSKIADPQAQIGQYSSMVRLADELTDYFNQAGRQPMEALDVHSKIVDPQAHMGQYSSMVRLDMIPDDLIDYANQDGRDKKYLYLPQKPLPFAMEEFNILSRGLKPLDISMVRINNTLSEWRTFLGKYFSANIRHLRKDEYNNFIYKLVKDWYDQQGNECHSAFIKERKRYSADTVQSTEAHRLTGPQTSSHTTEALIDKGRVHQVQVQFQTDLPVWDVEAQISEPSLDPDSIPDPVGLEGGFSDHTTAEHDTGMLQDNIAADTGELMTGGRQNMVPFSGVELSLPDDPEQNTGILRAFCDLFRPIRSNTISQMVFLSGCNFFSNAMVGVNYLHKDLQGVHDTFWKAQLIASVGAPIAVSVFTLLSSFWFASDPEGWSNWITGLSRVNAGLIAGGPLNFYFMRYQGTKK